MRKHLLTVVGLAAALTIALGGTPASAAPLPTGASTLTGTAGVATSDSITAQTFTGAHYTFTPFNETTGSHATDNVIIVDVELPGGVTLTSASLDVSSGCTTTNATVTVAGSTASVSGVSCAAGQTLVVDVAGSSLITHAGSYNVTAQYKRSTPRRVAPKGGPNPNMWKVTDTGGFTVGVV